MYTSDFITRITNTNKELHFELMDAREIGGDLHITEIKNVQVDSTDCGGNQHSYKETVVQLWQNERSKKLASWNTKKVSDILEVVQKKMKINGETELYIEFGNSNYRTSVHRVNWKETDQSITLELQPIYTQCKPASLTKLACC